MAKENKQLAKSLRSRGIRKRVADDIARTLGGGPKRKSGRQSISDLVSAVREINDRLGGGAEKRSAAAKKGARTRKRKAQKRSEAAKRGARKRARD
jgi:hypothetical protein